MENHPVGLSDATNGRVLGVLVNGPSAWQMCFHPHRKAAFRKLLLLQFYLGGLERHRLCFLIPPNYNVINSVKCFPTAPVTQQVSICTFSSFSFDHHKIIYWLDLCDRSVFWMFGPRNSCLCCTSVLQLAALCPANTQTSPQIFQKQTPTLAAAAARRARFSPSRTCSHISSQWAPGPLLNFNIQTPPGSFAAFTRGTVDPTQS